MKKILSMVLIFALIMPCVVLLAACGDKTNANEVIISVEASSEEGGIVTITAPAGEKGKYNKGDSIRVTATHNPGYYFDGWFKDGVKVSSDSFYIFVANENSRLFAQFQLESYKKVNVTIEGGTGSGTYNVGDTVTITSSDEAFLWWQVEGRSTKLSTSKTYSFKASENIKIVSHGKNRAKGFAILETTNMSTWSSDKSYTFTTQKYDLLYKAYVNGVEVSAIFLQDNNPTSPSHEVWKYTNGFNLIDPFGTSKYEIKNPSSPYTYVFKLYRDIDGSIKAFGSIPYNMYMKGATVTLDTGSKILFENTK